VSDFRGASMRMRLNRGRHSAVTSGFETERYRSQLDLVVCIDYEFAPQLVLFDFNPQNIFLVCVAIQLHVKGGLLPEDSMTSADIGGHRRALALFIT
jgi:hypothetical protein